MSNLSASPERREATIASPKRSDGRCLVVHDDLELRLRLGTLVRRAIPTLDADCISSASFDALTPERIASYIALFLIVEFNRATARLIRSHGSCARANNRATAHIRICARRRRAQRGAHHQTGSQRLLADPLGENRRIGRGSEAADGAGAQFRRRRHPGGRFPASAANRRLPPDKDHRGIGHGGRLSGRNDDLTQPVALKVQALKGRGEVTEADRQRFVRECQILSALNHRSIADVLDYGITDEYSYLALEYFPCGSLRDRLKNPVSEADAVNYARQIGDALQVLHSANVVHRDLKPSNLMLTDDNRLILIDFGSASMRLAASDLSRSDLCTGTPYYVCPEQIDNRDPDGRGDLYSLGVVLYEMLVGALRMSATI